VLEGTQVRAHRVEDGGEDEIDVGHVAGEVVRLPEPRRAEYPLEQGIELRLGRCAQRVPAEVAGVLAAGDRAGIEEVVVRRVARSIVDRTRRADLVGGEAIEAVAQWTLNRAGVPIAESRVGEEVVGAEAAALQRA